MCLSLSEWRELSKIDKAMRRTDPRLASLLAIFTRLAASEAMPGHERLRYRGSQIRAALALVIIAVLRVISQVLDLAARIATGFVLVSSQIWPRQRLPASRVACRRTRPCNGQQARTAGTDRRS